MAVEVGEDNKNTILSSDFHNPIPFSLLAISLPIFTAIAGNPISA